MGCDIHGPWLFEKASYSSSEGMTWLRAKFRDWGRDYVLFALLADVRNDGSLDAVAEPRGYPTDWLGLRCMEWDLGVDTPDASPVCDAPHAEAHGISADCHSMSWLTTDELIEVQRRYKATTGESHAAVARAIVFMRMMENETDAEPRLTKYELRLVFCFDN